MTVLSSSDMAVMTAPKTTYQYTDKTTDSAHSTSITSLHDGSVGATFTTHIQATTEKIMSDDDEASASAGDSGNISYLRK